MPRWSHPPEAPNELGARIRFHRVRVALSQNMLARLAGCDPAYVNRLERAPAESAGSPSRRVVLALADALELDPPDTDRLLYLAGLAPLTDWQRECERLAERLHKAVDDVVAVTLGDNQQEGGPDARTDPRQLRPLPEALPSPQAALGRVARARAR